MALELDFNKLKREYLRITLNDESQTILNVKLATKSTVLQLNEVYRDMLNLDNPSIDDLKKRNIIDDLYQISAILLSHNKENKTISSDQLKTLWDDLDYLIAFVNVYIDFINYITKQKN